MPQPPQQQIVPFGFINTPFDPRTGRRLPLSDVREIRPLTVQVEYADYLSCTDEHDQTVYVAKPFMLRQTPFDARTVGSVAYVYSNTYTRTADGETQTVTPTYILTTERILAARIHRGVLTLNSGGTLEMMRDPDGDRIEWEDINECGRTWAEGAAAAWQLVADDLISIPTTASDGTRTISTDNWADRLVHYEMVIGYNPFGDAPDPPFTFDVLSLPYHDRFLVGSAMGEGWYSIISYVAGGGTLQFQCQGSTGNLRWQWSNASSWPGLTWYRIRALAGVAKTEYDFTAS